MDYALSLFWPARVYKYKLSSINGRICLDQTDTESTFNGFDAVKIELKCSPEAMCHKSIAMRGME